LYNKKVGIGVSETEIEIVLLLSGSYVEGMDRKGQVLYRFQIRILAWMASEKVADERRCTALLQPEGVYTIALTSDI
jgi:hypothetical protein